MRARRQLMAAYKSGRCVAAITMRQAGGGGESAKTGRACGDVYGRCFSMRRVARLYGAVMARYAVKSCA